MLSNIKFRYMYRDECNYKNYSFVIFSNPDEISLDEIKTRLEKSFFGSLLFSSRQMGLKELFFEDFPVSDYMTLHEFDSVETTDEVPTDSRGRTIKQFIKKAEKESVKGWKTINSHEESFPRIMKPWQFALPKRPRPRAG